jgi:hypothetical protein
VRVLHQQNTGLTRALARGCGEARGEFIARQDAGDLSLPQRLFKQRERLKQRPQEALVSCWTVFVGPEDEELVVQGPPDDPASVTRSLRARDVDSVRNLSHHGTAFFRRRDYERAGGYRAQLYVAQDLDLWLRLTDGGMVGTVPEVLYRARIVPSSLSGRYRSQQFALAAIGLELARVRENGGDETPLLDQAARVRPSAPLGHSRRDTANGLYFIGKCLLDRRDRRCRRYLREALRTHPLHLRAAAALAVSTWRT